MKESEAPKPEPSELFVKKQRWQIAGFGEAEQRLWQVESFCCMDAKKNDAVSWSCAEGLIFLVKTSMRKGDELCA